MLVNFEEKVGSFAVIHVFADNLASLHRVLVCVCVCVCVCGGGGGGGGGGGDKLTLEWPHKELIW